MSGYVFGVSEVQAALDRMVVKAQAQAVEIVNASEAVVEANIKKQFTLAGRTSQGRDAHGRFTRTSRGTPSPPGSPPAVQSGTLRRSIKSERARPDGLGASGRVYPTAVYARIQELGGVAGHGAVLPPRPYVQPGYRASLPEIEAIAVREWRRMLL